MASDPTVFRLFAALAADIEASLPVIRSARAKAGQAVWERRRPLADGIVLLIPQMLGQFGGQTRSSTALTSSGKNPPSPVSRSPSASIRSSAASSISSLISALRNSRAVTGATTDETADGSHAPGSEIPEPLTTDFATDMRCALS